MDRGEQEEVGMRVSGSNGQVSGVLLVEKRGGGEGE